MQPTWRELIESLRDPDQSARIEEFLARLEFENPSQARQRLTQLLLGGSRSLYQGTERSTASGANSAAGTIPAAGAGKARADAGRAGSQPGSVTPDQVMERSQLIHLGRNRQTSEIVRMATLEQLIAIVSSLPHPDQSILNFERYIQKYPDPDHLYSYLAAHPRAVEILLKLFVGSQYLTGILLRRPALLEQLTHHHRLADLRSRQEFFEGAVEAVSALQPGADPANAVRRFRHSEMLRIGACDTFGLMDFRGVVNQLSLLADAVVECGLRLAAGNLYASVSGFTVLALGKLGGEELNYSSDIDLVFLHRGNTDDLLVAQRLVRFLNDASDEGFLYRVDTRLRPWGRSGNLVSTPEAYLTYLSRHAAIWEKQALIKARVIAGDFALGEEFLGLIENVIHGAPESAVRASIRESKQKIEQGLVRRGRQWGEVKSGMGSIRDIEFIVQYLQMTRGLTHPHIRSRNTLDSLVRLADQGFLQADEYRQLTVGYVFLRTIEHAIQLMHNKQDHALPENERELSYLARRLDFPDAATFIRHYEDHSREIRRIYEKYLLTESVEPIEIQPLRISSVETFGLVSYEKAFSKEERQKHRDWLQELTIEQSVRVDASSMPDGAYRVTVLGVDEPGDLSMICGLLFVYGFDICSGDVFTDCHPSEILSRYAQSLRTNKRVTREAHQQLLRDFVDVFHAKPLIDAVVPELWQRYEDDLRTLKHVARTKGHAEAQGLLAKRVAAALRGNESSGSRLLPVEISVQDARERQATLLCLKADDSIGFLYEFTNALAICGVAIEQMSIRNEGHRVQDTLLITDARRGGRIQDDRHVEELKAAIALIQQFTHLLPKAPNPEAALVHFRQFLQELFLQEAWWEQLSSLERPEVLDALAKLLGISDFLWQDFLRLQHSNLFPVLADVEGLQVAKTKEQLAEELRQEIFQGADLSRWQLRLNSFKDREMFRIDMRHILGHIGPFGHFSNELTDLAEVVVSRAFEMSLRELTWRHGSPLLHAGTPCRWTVLALGKCGGKEMGFASDIELMLVYEGEGKTDGPRPIATSEFFHRLVELFSQSIFARQEGIFRIDLRLRPYGKAGNLAVSKEAFISYFGFGGPAWPYERQALVKLRHVAGDQELGKTLEAFRDQVLYSGQKFDFAAMRALRERQVRQLSNSDGFNAKLSPGGLVDCEYLVQALQLTWGSTHPELRTTNTREALRMMRDLELLPFDDAEKLKAAYRFHRALIDALRMVRGDARDLTVPPASSEEFEFLARRLGYHDREAELASEMEKHIQVVTELVRRWTDPHLDSHPAVEMASVPGAVLEEGTHGSLGL